MQLYAGEEHIASFTPVLKGPQKGDPHLEPARLELSPRLTVLKEAQDYAVLSLLLIEKVRRFGGSMETSVPTGAALGLVGFNLPLTRAVGYA